MSDPLDIDPELDELQAKLKDPNADSFTRIAAVKRLGKIGSPIAVQLLLRNLDDREEVVRGEVVDALGEAGDPKAVPHVVEILEEGPDDLKVRAAGALGKIKGGRAEFALQQELPKSQGAVRRAIMEALDAFDAEEEDFDSEAEHTKLILASPVDHDTDSLGAFRDDSISQSFDISNIAMPTRQPTQPEQDSDAFTAIRVNPAVQAEAAADAPAPSAPAPTPSAPAPTPSASAPQPPQPSASTVSKFDALPVIKKALEGWNHPLKEDPKGIQHSVTLRLPFGRRQKVYILAGNEDLEGEPVLYVYTICGPATPENYEFALESNMKRTHGALAIVKTGDKRLLVFVDSFYPNLSEPKLLMKCITTLAIQGDKMENFITGGEDKR